MKDNINIAVVFWGINDEYQGKICRGISDRANELKNVTISYFASFVTNFKIGLVNEAENVIYSLINFDFFDALVVIPNNFDFNTKVLDDLILRAKKSNVPIFSLDVSTEGCINLLIDNVDAIRSIVDHVIEKHGAKELVYVGGLKNAPYDADKLTQFKESLDAHGLEYDEEKFLWAKFTDKLAKRELRKYLEKYDSLPDAFICANDSMALGIIYELEDRGYSVPDDVIITGFDGIMTNTIHDPSITSVEVPYEKLGYNAVNVILEYLKDPTVDIKALEARSLIKSDPSFYGSCGCKSDEKIKRNDLTRLMGADIYRSIYINEYLIKMSTDLSSCDTIDEYYETLKEYVSKINLRSVYFCYSEEYLKQYDANDPNLDNYTVPKKTELSETIGARIIYRNKTFLPPQTFNKSEMLPALHEPCNHSREFIFMPLHFLDRTFGYVAGEIKSGFRSRNSGILNLWTNFIAIAHDSVREKIMTARYTKILENLYRHDALTQALNRCGLIAQRDKIYADSGKDRLDAMVFLVDLDDMKGINDKYGHNAGDDALIAVTDSLMAVIGENDLVCRHGGDEFLVFGVGYDEDQAEMLGRRFTCELERLRIDRGLDFKITASYGYCVEENAGVDDFEKMTANADKNMYKSKNAKPNRKHAGVLS